MRSHAAAQGGPELVLDARVGADAARRLGGKHQAFEPPDLDPERCQRADRGPLADGSAGGFLNIPGVQATGDPHELRILPLEFARGLGTSLDRTSATLRTTTLVLLMAALETAVFDTFPTQKAVINTATFGRLKPELLGLIGVFANVVTVVSERRKVKAASAHVRDVHDRLYDAERNSEPDMVASLMSAGAPRPKVPILFLNYQAYPNSAGWEFEGLACEKVDIPIGSRPPVSLAQVAITREGDSLRGSLGYDAGRLSLEVATHLREGMVRALNELPFGVDALS